MDSAQGCKQGVPKGDARRGCIQNDHSTFFNLFQMATPLFNLFKMATNKSSRKSDVMMTCQCRFSIYSFICAGRR